MGTQPSRLQTKEKAWHSVELLQVTFLQIQPIALEQHAKKQHVELDHETR